MSRSENSIQLLRCRDYDSVQQRALTFPELSSQYFKANKLGRLRAFASLCRWWQRIFLMNQGEMWARHDGNYK